MQVTKLVMTSALLAASCFSSGDPGTVETAPACPHLQIREGESVPAGTQAKIWVSAIGAKAPITFRWTVTEGTITRGQGTDTILIDTGGLAGTTLRADVEIVGLAPECVSRSASTFVLVGTPITTTSR